MYEEIGNLLINARIELGMTQNQLATRVGVSSQQIQRYERTKYKSIALCRLCQVAKVLEVKLNPQGT